MRDGLGREGNGREGRRAGGERGGEGGRRGEGMRRNVGHPCNVVRVRFREVAILTRPLGGHEDERKNLGDSGIHSIQRNKPEYFFNTNYKLRTTNK